MDAWPGRVFRGVVQQIRQAPINVQNVITYNVVIQVSNEDLALFPGMTANVTISVARAAGATLPPHEQRSVAPAESRVALSSVGRRLERKRGSKCGPNGLRPRRRQQSRSSSDLHGNL